MIRNFKMKYMIYIHNEIIKNNHLKLKNEFKII